jgi:hypothetical protein
VQEVRKRDFAGVSFFFYESLSNWASETPEQRNSALQEFFPQRCSARHLKAEFETYG